mgnify:CR=1 FL=1
MNRQTGSVFIPRVVSDYIIKFRQANLQFAKFVTVRSEDVSFMGQTIDFPTSTELTASAYVDGNDLMDLLSAPIETKKSLTVSELAVCPEVILDTLSAQAKTDAKALAIERCGYAIAKRVDTVIRNEMLDFSVNTIQNELTPSTAITKNHLLDAQKTLDLLDVPEEDRVWFLGPNAIRDLMADTGNYFTSMDFADTKALVKGQLQYLILGSPVVKTTNLATGTAGSPVATYYKNGYFHKSAIGLAMQKDVEVQQEYTLRFQGLTINARCLFGTETLRPNHGVMIYR